jgi:hypothetical protein
VGFELFAMTGRLGAIAARRHVAPPAPAVLGVIVENALAAWVGATAHARQLSEDERVRGGFDDWNDETREGVSHWHKRADECAVGA